MTRRKAKTRNMGTIDGRRRATCRSLSAKERERERERRAHACALCLIFDRMDGQSSRRRNQSIKSIWRLPTDCTAVSLSPLLPIIISPSFSFCHRSGSTKTIPPQRTGCLSISLCGGRGREIEGVRERGREREREHHVGHCRGKQASCLSPPPNSDRTPPTTTCYCREPSTDTTAVSSRKSGGQSEAGKSVHILLITPWTDGRTTDRHTNTALTDSLATVN